MSPRCLTKGVNHWILAPKSDAVVPSFPTWWQVYLRLILQGGLFTGISELMTKRPGILSLRAESGELLHLDLLRFIASVGIVLHHSIEFFVSPDKRPALDSQTMGLALFVDLFFVISGYVIAYVYHNRMTSKLDYFRFLQRRIGRLIPLHWVTLSITIVLWAALSLLHYSGKHAASFDPLCIADTALLTHAYIPCGNNIYFNGVSWSVSVEMVMYIAFPVFTFIGAKNARYSLSFGLIALVALVAFAYFQQGVTLSEISWVDISPVLRALPSFILGSALFYNRKFAARLPIPDIILVLAGVGLIIAMVTGTSQLYLIPLIYLVAVAAVSADARSEEKTSKFVKHVAPLGQLTYSVYMWHTLLIFVFMNAIGDKFLHGNLITTLILAMICYIVIFVISYFSFFYLETPARRWIDKLPLARNKSSLVQSESS
jgi:peptidoglycan/LPS O-acetylase OafA/YrhL